MVEGDAPRTPRRSRLCPSCGTVGLPLASGLPPYDPMGLAAEQGLIKLAGCGVTENDPTWHCPNCDTEWDGPDPDRAIREALKKVEGSAFLQPLRIDK